MTQQRTAQPRRQRFRTRHPESRHAPLDAHPSPALGGEVLELRVHGVSGTPPEELLDRPLVTQVAGDRIAGFYMPREPDARMDESPCAFSPRRSDAPRLAGYSWGGLTSGSPARALWLILLPFTLVNVAPRSRPPGRHRTSLTVRAIWYFSRLLALTLTCLYVSVGVGVGEDLIGWQCPGTTACVNASPGWLFDGLSFEHRLSTDHMLLVGTLVPIAQLLVVWAASQRTANRYERTVADLGKYRDGISARAADDTNDAELPLSSALMWRNADSVRRLRAVHMQVGFALVLWTVLGATEPPRDGWDMLSGHGWTLVPLTVIVYAVVALAMPSLTGQGPSRRWRVASGVIWGLIVLGGGVQLLGLLFSGTWVDDAFLGNVPKDGRLIERVTAGGLPYYPGTVLGVCIAAGLALGLLLVTVIGARIADLVHGHNTVAVGDHRPVPMPLFGLATGAFACLGVFLAAAFSAGTYVFAATWLHTGSVKPGFTEVARTYRMFTVPAAIGTANVAYAVAVIILAGLLLVTLAVIVVRYLWWPGSHEQVGHDYPRDTEVSGPDHGRRDVEIRRAMFVGRLVDHAQWFVAAMVVNGLIVIAWFGVKLAQRNWHASSRVFGSVDGGLSASRLGGLGAYLGVLTVVGLVTLGSLAFRVRATRRSVGILWDVAAFWPRACHPLAAPCYAERTVPDLITFITAYRLRHQTGALVLAAHSQGTVIGAATLRQLATFDAQPKPEKGEAFDILPRVSFLTFGCVLRRLYGRFFPVYFGPAELYELEVVLGGGVDEETNERRTPRWRNLWRYTDYLGGQVTAGPPQDVPARSSALVDPAVLPHVPAVHGPVDWEWHSPDPPSFGRRPGDTTYPSAHRHSDFWSDESGYFQLAAAELAESVRVVRPADPTETPREAVNGKASDLP